MNTKNNNKKLKKLTNIIINYKKNIKNNKQQMKI